MSLKLPNKHVGALHNAALASFQDEVALRLWVQFNMAENLNQIKKDPGLPAMVLELFYFVDSRDGWAAFLQAGINSTDRPVFSSACQEALQALPQQQPVAGAPKAKAGKELLIWDRVPFIDREPFWTDIEELQMSPRKRVAMVSGPPKSGKSYCGELLDHLRRGRWSKARFALVDLKDDQSPDIKPEELCRRVLLKLRIKDAGDPPPPLPGQKPDRWARDLGAWTASAIEALDEDVWLVFDGFNDSAVVEETHVLLAGLAEEAGEQGRFRIILLDYDRAFGERTERATRRTRIDYLTGSDLRSFLRALDQQHNVSAKPGWRALLEFVDQYDRQTPGSATQLDALRDLLPPLVRDLLA